MAKRRLILTNDIWELFPTDKAQRETYAEMCEINETEIGSDENMWDYLQDLTNSYFADGMCEIEHHEKRSKKTYVISADLGLWYGRSAGGKVITELANALRQMFEDTNRLEQDGRGRLMLTASHHDGTNYYRIKELTEAGEMFYENHEYEYTRREMVEKLFGSSKYSRHPRIFREIYGF